MPIIPLPPIDLSTRCGQYTERTPGLHLSDILHDILFTMYPERFGGPANYANFMMGLVLERALELAWLDRERMVRPELVRPGEMVQDGILITPDAVDARYNRPEEYKFTKMSCRQDITDRKFAHYWWQVKSQAFAMGATEGVLVILHVNGNYNRSGVLPDGTPDPEAGYVVRPWLGQWTQLELEEHWYGFIHKHAVRKGWVR